jgi:hypothetical protein
MILAGKLYDFDWMLFRLIPDHICTTVHHSLAAYDRIIVCSDDFNKIIVPNSGKVFRYNDWEELKPIGQGWWSLTFLGRIVTPNVGSKLLMIITRVRCKVYCPFLSLSLYVKRL